MTSLRHSLAIKRVLQSLESALPLAYPNMCCTGWRGCQQNWIQSNNRLPNLAFEIFWNSTKLNAGDKEVTWHVSKWQNLFISPCTQLATYACLLYFHGYSWYTYHILSISARPVCVPRLISKADSRTKLLSVLLPESIRCMVWKGPQQRSVTSLRCTEVMETTQNKDWSWLCLLYVYMCTCMPATLLR